MKVIRVISVSSLREKAKQLKIDVYALYLAYKDPRVPWHAKIFIALIVGYALSPIDLIPDFIPVLGYLDDLIIIPAGISLSLKMIPKEVLEECRGRVESVEKNEKLDCSFYYNFNLVIISIFIFKIYLADYFLKFPHT